MTGAVAEVPSHAPDSHGQRFQCVRRTTDPAYGKDCVIASARHALVCPELAVTSIGPDVGRQSALYPAGRIRTIFLILDFSKSTQALVSSSWFVSSGPTVLYGATEPPACKPCQSRSGLWWAPTWVIEYQGVVCTACGRVGA